MKMFYTLLLLILIGCSGNSQQLAQTDLQSEDTAPFKVYKTDYFVITAHIESPELYNKYGEIFEKYGYSGNGYSWEGHIAQIIKKEAPDLTKHIMFDSEAGAFFAYASSENAQNQFLNLLCPIFKDTDNLESYISAANRRKIDD